jgi:hypothetical protein
MPILISHSGSLDRPSDLYFSEYSEIQGLAIELDPKIKFLNSESSNGLKNDFYIPHKGDRGYEDFMMGYTAECVS